MSRTANPHRQAESTTALRPLYSAGGQLVRVRGIMLLSLACGVAGVWWGFSIVLAHGPFSADGVWGPIVGVMASAFTAGMWVYGRCYAASIEYDPKQRQLHVRTVRFFGSTLHVIDAARIGARRWHQGEYIGLDAPSVHAPWIAVRLAGWRLPLIIDAQGTVLDPSLMGTLFGVR